MSCRLSAFTKVPFIAVPHLINCSSSYAKTLLFIDFKKTRLDDVSMICGLQRREKDQGWKRTCSKGQNLLEYSSIRSASTQGFFSVT